MSRPRLLDLCSGAGGASAGYVAAGFDVTGVDVRTQPRYPYAFHRADALTFPLDGFDAVHASPPCQRWSKSVARARRDGHPDLIGPLRERLAASGLPYVIENVPGSPLRDPVILCGTQFGRPLRRHRLFESNVPLSAPLCRHEDHPPRFAPAWNRRGLLRFVQPSGGWTSPHDRATVQAVMAIDWMSPSEISEAIPSYYTEHIGRQVMRALR